MIILSGVCKLKFLGKYIFAEFRQQNTTLNNSTTHRRDGRLDSHTASISFKDGAAVVYWSSQGRRHIGLYSTVTPRKVHHVFFKTHNF